MELRVLSILWQMVILSTALEQASFFGSSYIHVPLQDARSTTEIQFRFKTKRTDTFILLAAGRTDYCLLRLESGKLKVHINLGAGESEIASARGLRLDDLNWHTVSIKRSEADFVLVIDNLHTTREKLPGRFFELNIHYGVFLGGQGDFSELFLGHHDALRGCLSDVIYNGINVLRKARDRNGTVDVQGVTWTCSPEFEAGVSKDISFVEDGAFMSLVNPIARTGARWEFEIKTAADNGLLLYNTGLTSRSDYVGVEIVDRHLRLLVEKGNGPTELISDATVTDGAWHSVVIHFSPSFMEISVDKRTSTLQLAPGGNRFLDLGDVLFLGTSDLFETFTVNSVSFDWLGCCPGFLQSTWFTFDCLYPEGTTAKIAVGNKLQCGMELNKRARALGQGVKSADLSLKGCFRNMSFDSKRMGLSDAKTTQGLLPECVWKFACIQKPCIAGGICRQVGVEGFRCDCEQRDDCVRPEFADNQKKPLVGTSSINLDIVNINPVTVDEGKNALITAENIDVVLDYRKYGVRDSGLLIHVASPPEHGKVEVENWEKRSSGRQVFTMLDIAKDKVRYLHDGSENHHDSITFDLELSPESGFVPPDYLQGHHRFTLQVNVTAVNDPPLLTFGPSKVLRLAQGTKKILTSDLLHAEDADNPSSDLVYTVLHQGNRGNEERGLLERLGQPGVKVDTFTQGEVDNGTIVYVHKNINSSASTRLALQVSDGVETSSPAFLRVSTFPLQVRLLNNTGIVLTHNSHMLITPANLSFITNADDPSLEIRFEITSSPQYGEVQRLRPSDSSEDIWQTVTSFNSFQIARSQIRYLHNSGSPSQDSFQFKVAVLQVSNPSTYSFRIMFTKLMLELEKLSEVQLNGTRDVTITENELKYISKPLTTPKKDIIYKILKGPKYGYLLLTSNKKRYLLAGDIYTQDDIENGRLRYRLHRKGYSHIKDDFIFQASVPEVETSPRALTFIHTPTPKARSEVKVTLERLQVDEGGRKNLLPTHLDLRVGVITALIYNITHGPSHGRIEITDSKNNVIRRNSTYFTSDELLNEHVFYCHDDSETKKDRFNFIALSSEEEDFQYVGVFHVDVLLKNDNSPVRSVNKVFNVVIKGEKLLTGRDLMYSDIDIDTQPKDIVYTRRGIPNGGLYSATDPSKAVFDFTQEDLNEGRILFRHDGDEYGKIGLWITDGKFFDNGLLEVNASAPYVVLVNNTNLIVQHGGSKPINSQQLAAETNINTGSERIIYEVIEGPGHGFLLILPQAEPLDKFSQYTLDQGLLTYSHDGSSSIKDFFRFRVNIQGTTTEGIFEIKIYPVSFWEDLIIKHNRTLLVEESTSILITSDDLEVMHPSVAPSDVTYIITKGPTGGSLEIDPPAGTDIKDEAKEEVKLFEQYIINEKRLRYVQEIANKTDDYFSVDVTNGITWWRGLWIRLTVIPEFIYIDGGVLNCLEGHTVTLSPSLLAVQGGYYRGKIADYRVIQKPNHGSIRSLKQTGIEINKFSTPQLHGNLIQYNHDGSESLTDSFTLVGRAGEKESLPITIRVIIQAINDQPPVIVNNTGLELWEGSSAIISQSELAATDEDTLPENLTYTITSVNTGFVAHVINPNKAIQEFTQAQINAKQILFLQTGGHYGAFHFQISDGDNLSKPTTFTVTARQVEITLVHYETLHIFPMLGKPITSMDLLAVTSDHTSSRARSISFNVKTPPTMGKLVLHDRNGEVVEVDSFTQRDINESRIWYQHMQRFNRLSARDSFVFDVTAEFTKSLMNQEFEVIISVSSGGLNQFVDVTPLEVREGEQQPVKINTSRLVHFLEREVGLEGPELQIQLSSKSLHGDVCAGKDCNTTIFSNDIIYRHDDSDTLDDVVSLAIYLHPGDVLLCNITCPVTIHPVNDQLFKLVTVSPYLTVVQGQSHNFTDRDLLTEDADTAPENITYEIVSGPSQGYISVGASNRSLDAAQKVRFSQADVNAGRVVYYHSGPQQPTSFYFRVWDGYFNPTYTVFNIHVLPLTLNVTSYAPIFLQQCSSITLITIDHITVVTNGESRNIKYNITKSPQFGVIYLGDSPANFFTQDDLINRKVMYMQVEMTAPSDTFQLATWLIETETPPTVDLHVIVKPLIVVGSFNPIIGLKNRLGTFALDASPLAKVTNSNPTYEIVRKTRLGRLKKIVRSSGEKKNVKEKEITKFSHEELKSGVIYYVIRKSVVPEEYHGMEDSFQVLVQGAVFQPARLEFKFKVYPEGTNVTTTTLNTIPLPPRLPGPKTPVGHEGGILVASPNIKKDYILIIGVVLGVLVLATIVIIMIRCRAVKRQKKNKGDLQGPLPLPRPPDDLLPSSPRIKRFAASNGSTPSSMPQCKVIPLGPVDSLAGSDMEINARYPYGMSDDPGEDWTSYDASEGNYPHRPTNPMLRRNQYWV